MARAGRKRKPGKRYAKNNRLTRTATSEDAMETALSTRMRHFDVSKTAALERDPAGPQLMGFPLGRLFKRQYISKAQYVAGNRFAEIMRGYLLTKGIGSPTAPAFDMDRHGTSLTGGSVQHEDEARQMMEALAEVDRLAAGRSATAVVWDVCLREYSEHLDQAGIGRLRGGLNAIDRVMRRRERISRKTA